MKLYFIEVEQNGKCSVSEEGFKTRAIAELFLAALRTNLVFLPPGVEKPKTRILECETQAKLVGVENG